MAAKIWYLKNVRFFWPTLYIAVNGTSFHIYGVSLAIWDHTVLPATRHNWTHPALTPARQAVNRLTYTSGMERWVGLSTMGVNKWLKVIGRPHGRWIVQLRRDNNKPPANQWKQAINRSHSGRVTQLSPDYATTWPGLKVITWKLKAVLVGLEPVTAESLVWDLTTTPPSHWRTV